MGCEWACRAGGSVMALRSWPEQHLPPRQSCCRPSFRPKSAMQSLFLRVGPGLVAMEPGAVEPPRKVLAYKEDSHGYTKPLDK